MSEDIKGGVKPPLLLSYSSMNDMLTCQTKYAHKKVWGTAVDEEDDTLPFRIGKAFHQVLEKSFHNAFHPEHLAQALEEFEVTEHAPLLKAMGKKYVRLHKASGIQIVKVEFEITNPKYRGFIDAIGVDDAGGWWIIDLKTSGRFESNLLPRLPQDLQLNLYSKFATEMGERIPELEGKTFRGARYRVTTKPKLVMNKKESPDQYEERLYSNCESYDVVIPVSVMNPSLAYSVFEDAYQVASAIHSGEVPLRNYKACLDYFRPCPYFSQCHKKKFNDSFDQVTVLTTEILQETDIL